MTRQILVLIHACSGLLGLIVGVAVFAPPDSKRDPRRSWRLAFAGLIVVLTASLMALIVTDWPALATGARLAFTGLAGLAGVMLIRVWMAHRLVGSRKPGWSRRYVGHIYFAYVSLWVGFAIIPALRSPAPGVWIPIAVAGVLSVGTVLIRRHERRIGLREFGAREVQPASGSAKEPGV